MSERHPGRETADWGEKIKAERSGENGCYIPIAVVRKLKNNNNTRGEREQTEEQSPSVKYVLLFIHLAVLIRCNPTPIMGRLA